MMLVRLLVETPGRKDGDECLYDVGEVINISDDLSELWLADGRAVLAEETATATPPAPASLEDMTVAELRELAKEKGVSYSGLKKADLISELEMSYVG